MNLMAEAVLNFTILKPLPIVQPSMVVLWIMLQTLCFGDLSEQVTSRACGTSPSRLLYGGYVSIFYGRVYY